MEKLSLDESLEKILILCSKLENQVRTMAAIDRKCLALTEQGQQVRRNFVKTEKRFSQVVKDLPASVQAEGGLTDDQSATLDQILDKMAENQKLMSSFALISQKGN